MTYLHAPTVEPFSPALADAAADYLLQLLPAGRPRRVARMLDYQPGGDKYRDLPRSAPFGRAQLYNHIEGRATYATTLAAVGQTRLGAIEVDAGGRAAVLAVLAAAADLGLTAYAIAVDNPLSGHAGGHVWFIYDQACPVVDVVAQLRAVATAAGLPSDTEIWPSNQVIRLPFGVHRWAQTRGELLLQSGEIVSLDRNLAAGVDLVLSLPRNDAPPATQPSAPAPNVPNSPRRISPGEQAAEQLGARPAQRRPRSHSPGMIDTKAIAAEVRKRFNQESNWSDLLSDAGGAEMHGGWRCNCGYKHSGSIQIAITSQDKIVSYSPNCRWAPHRNSGRALDKFGFYIDQKHAGSYRAAVETLARDYNLWVEPAPAPADDRSDAERRASQQVSAPHTEYILAPEEQSQQAAEAQRKRSARREAAAAAIADVRARAAADPDLRPSDRAVLDTLLQVAGHRGWCRPSKERIAELSGYSLGSVKRSLMTLEAAGYFTSEGDGGAAGQTAIRTFLRGSCFEGQTVAAPNDDPRIMRTCDLDTDSRACEGGAIPPPDRELLSYVRALARELGDAAALQRDYAELDQVALLAEAAHLEQLLAGVDQVEPHPGISPDSAELADGAPSAWYDPGADWTAGGRLQLQAERGQSEGGAPVLVELDPLVQAPPLPSEPAYGEFVWRWLASQEGAIDGRTGMRRPPAQRQLFRDQARRYLVDVPAKEASLRWAELRRLAPAAPAAARAGKRRRPAAGARAAPPSQAPAPQLQLALFAT